MSRFARRQDANHNELIEAYERLGVAVIDLSKAAEVVRPGLPDLLCSLHGHTWLTEVKTDNGGLSPVQLHFMAQWKGLVEVAYSVDDVIAIVKAARLMVGAGRFVKRKA